MVSSAEYSCEGCVASLADRARFVSSYLVPNWLQGLLTGNRFWVTIVSALHTDPLGIRLIARLRHKYRSEYIVVSKGRQPMLLVLEPEGIRRVLARSPDVYAEPKPKRLGMLRFQPDAVTISRGSAWEDRRRFNVAALESGSSVHSQGASMLRIIRDECQKLRPASPGLLGWRDFERLFELITLQIVFGRGARDDEYLMRTLRKLMVNGNRARLVPPRKRLLFEFQAAVRTYVNWPEDGSLVSLFRTIPASPGTRPENQLPHWMFAMNETLAANTARALALIAASPRVTTAVEAELASADLSSPADIERLTLLRGCLQEAMRLWPTTPMLMRESIELDWLGGRQLEIGTRILIPTSFLNRDTKQCADANEFRPERWVETPDDDRFLHLSHGKQVCAGQSLALFIGTAILSSLLQARQYRLVRPTLSVDRAVPESFNYFQLILSSPPRTA